MADDSTLYRARAVLEQANANAASLDNVRERAQRAANAWTVMADRADRAASLRTSRHGSTAETAPPDEA